MKIAIAGSGGFIGASYMENRSDLEFVPISRSLLYGDISLLKEALTGCEVVLNLAGSPIAKRWTRKRKKEIKESRNGVNSKMVKAVNLLENKPGLFISASAIGIYASGGVQTESDFELGGNFLASVVKGWEAPLKELDKEVNCAIVRIGIVLGKEGGALVPLLKMARLGILTIMGSGQQFFSFIHLSDLLRGIDFILTAKLPGIFNLTSPFPVDNATFTKTLAEVTGTRWIFRIPSLFIKIGLGEAHILMTAGPQVLPARLTGEGFRFDFPTAGEALRNLVENIEESH
jgi:uncharacterized protein (TIGR01777 family)